MVIVAEGSEQGTSLFFWYIYECMKMFSRRSRGCVERLTLFGEGGTYSSVTTIQYLHNPILRNTRVGLPSVQSAVSNRGFTGHTNLTFRTSVQDFLHFAKSASPNRTLCGYPNRQKVDVPFKSHCLIRTSVYSTYVIRLLSTMIQQRTSPDV